MGWTFLIIVTRNYVQPSKPFLILECTLHRLFEVDAGTVQVNHFTNYERNFVAHQRETLIIRWYIKYSHCEVIVNSAGKTSTWGTNLPELLVSVQALSTTECQIQITIFKCFISFAVVVWSWNEMFFKKIKVIGMGDSDETVHMFQYLVESSFKLVAPAL